MKSVILMILKRMHMNGSDPNLVTAIMARESAFKANARSPKDARGLMQVIPSTARLMGV
ncbi:transglycosylase SLT domain-containing protein, partial [Acinetobacter vivianii]